jgi:hypothetical protein
MKRYIIALMAMALSGLGLHAQTVQLSPQVFASQGQHFQNAQFELSYTIGELAAVSTVTAGNSTLTQGFHQPDKFIIASVFSPEYAWNAGVFPNPADQLVTLSLNSTDAESLVLELLDASGRRVSESRIIQLIPGQQQFDIALSHLASGVYLLRLSSTDGLRQNTLRINKSHS